MPASGSRRRLPGCPHRRHHDHARPAQGARRRAHRRGRHRQDLRPVLRKISPVYKIPAAYPAGQAGHGHDVAGEGNQEAGAGGDLHVAHRHGEAGGRAQLGLIVGEAVLGLGHADGHLVEAQSGELLDLLLGVGGEEHVLAAVDLLDNGGDLLLDGGVQLIGEGGSPAPL